MKNDDMLPRYVNVTVVNGNIENVLISGYSITQLICWFLCCILQIGVARTAYELNYEEFFTQSNWNQSDKMTTDISVVRWDPSQGPDSQYIDEYEYDGGNSSSRLFERSRIKALAGK